MIRDRHGQVSRAGELISAPRQAGPPLRYSESECPAHLDWLRFPHVILTANTQLPKIVAT